MANRNRIRQLCLKRNTEYAIPLQGKIRRYKLSVFDNPSITFRVSHTQGEVANGVGNAFNNSAPYDSGYIELTNPTLYLSADNDGGIAVIDYMSLQEVSSGGTSGTFSQTKYLSYLSSQAITGYASAVDWTTSSDRIYTNLNYSGGATGDNRTKWAKFSNGGFSIPTGATITGVSVDVAMRWGIDSTTTMFFTCQSIKLLKAGSLVVGLHDGVDTSLFGDPYASEFPPSLYPTVQDVANLLQPCDDNFYWINGLAMGGSGQPYWIDFMNDPTKWAHIKTGGITGAEINCNGHPRLGGTTLTPAQVNASDFGFGVSFRVDNPQYPNFPYANIPLYIAALGTTNNNAHAPRMTVYYTV